MMTLRIDLKTADLRAILRELSRVLRDKNWPVTTHEGLSGSEIRQQQQRFGLTLHSDLQVLYEWCDGWDPNPGIFPEFSLLPLDAVIDASRRQKNSWLPLLANGGGDYLYVASNAQYGPVMVSRVLDRVFGEPIYDSVRSLFSMILVAHAEGVLRVHEQGMMLLDDQKRYKKIVTRVTQVRELGRFRNLYSRLNPECAKGRRGRDMLW